jgi:hypothetical protein
MLSMLPLAVTTSIGPWAAGMGLGFLIGIAGHVIRSVLLVLIGILIVGGISIYFAFVVGRLGG